MKFRGVFAPIPTPFDQDEHISYPHLRHNLEKWAGTKLAGLVVLGSNGEFVFLDEDEKEAMVAFVREHFPREKAIIAGTGCESTRQTIEVTRRAARAGADAALVLNPSYYKGAMTDAVLRRFFFEVADASPIPVMIYNMPRNTGLNLSAELVVSLAEHPNIAGIKDSSGNIVQISEIVAGVREDFAVFAGSGSFLLPSILMGGVGGTLAVANVVPDLCADIVTLAEEVQADRPAKSLSAEASLLGSSPAEGHGAGSRLAEARCLQRKIIPLNAAVTTRWGIPGLKAALDLIGYYGGPPRRPLLPLPEEARHQLRQMLMQVGTLPAGQ